MTVAYLVAASASASRAVACPVEAAVVAWPALVAWRLGRSSANFP